MVHTEDVIGSIRHFLRIEKRWRKIFRRGETFLQNWARTERAAQHISASR
jgi:hypothetical protein